MTDKKQRLYRSRRAVVAGVCGGLAAYFGLDTGLVRIAALILAAGVSGAAAQGETRIGDIFHIQRGYQDPVGDLRQLGARIETG